MIFDVQSTHLQKHGNEMMTSDMTDEKYNAGYWESRWAANQTGWDIGYPSPPIINYFEQDIDKEAQILIPGCGNAWEGDALRKAGYRNVYLLDIAPTAIAFIKSHFPDFPEDHIIHGDFFKLDRMYDFIVEQTFFCALNPDLRETYVEKCYQLLKPGGKIVGVLFNRSFPDHHPPFGGSRTEYMAQFEPYFILKHFEECFNSIGPRTGSELFIECIKR